MVIRAFVMVDSGCITLAVVMVIVNKVTPIGS